MIYILRTGLDSVTVSVSVFITDLKSGTIVRRAGLSRQAGRQAGLINDQVLNRLHPPGNELTGVWREAFAIQVVNKNDVSWISRLKPSQHHKVQTNKIENFEVFCTLLFILTYKIFQDKKSFSRLQTIYCDSRNPTYFWWRLVKFSWVGSLVLLDLQKKKIMTFTTRSQPTNLKIFDFHNQKTTNLFLFEKLWLSQPDHNQPFSKMMTFKTRSQPTILEKYQVHNLITTNHSW